MIELTLGELAFTALIAFCLGAVLGWVGTVFPLKGKAYPRWQWLKRRRLLREQKLDRAVVAVLQQSPDSTGVDLSKATGIGPGRLYPTLFRLEKRGVITGWWEDMPYPRRRRYRLMECANA